MATVRSARKVASQPHRHRRGPGRDDRLPGADLLDRLDRLQAAGACRHRAADGVLQPEITSVHQAVHQARAVDEAGRSGRLRRGAVVGEAVYDGGERILMVGDDVRSSRPIRAASRTA